MKWMIASDIHGSAYWTRRLVARWKEEQPDRVILLGDLLYHGPRNALPQEYDPQQVIALLSAIPGIQVEVTQNWNKRYRENMQHIRSGDLCEVAQVIKSLSVRDRARGLSTGEKKMLEQAMQILESELAFALDRPAERIAEMLREHLCR